MSPPSAWTRRAGNGIFGSIEALRAEGKTILYTTHYMEEVERLRHRAVIMDHGRIIADDTVASLKSARAQRPARPHGLKRR